MKNLLKTTILVIVVLLITVYCPSSTILSEASKSTTSEYNLTAYIYDAETEEPIDNASVYVHHRWLDVLWNATTNATGYATFLLEEDEYYIAAGKSGYRSNGTPPFILDRNMTVNVSLTPIGPTYNLTVYVYDELEGEPIVWASVVVCSLNISFSYHNYTNVTGYATFMLEEGEYRIEVGRYNYETKIIFPPRIDRDITINVSLIPTSFIRYGLLSVHVYDAETKKSIEGASVDMYDLREDVLFDSMTTNSTGYASFFLPRDEYRDKYYIIVEKTGYKVCKVSPFLLDRNMTFNISLIPLQSSRGLPTGTTGNLVFISIGILIAIGIATSIVIMIKIAKKKKH